MNATELLKQMHPLPVVWRVRSKVDGVVGTVIDVAGDGWVYWFGDDKACRASAPDAVETVTS